MATADVLVDNDFVVVSASDAGPSPLLLPSATAASGAASSAAPAAATTAAAATSSLVWPPTHRHKDVAIAAVKKFKEEALKPNDVSNGWQPLANAKDVVATQKKTTTALGMLRGDGVILNYTTHECFAVSAFPSCRMVWDDMFESGKQVEVLDKSTLLSYAASKGQMFVKGRDFAVVLINEFFPDGRIFSISASVQDAKIPEDSGHVRGTLMINGWYFEPIDGGKSTRVVYINDIDINGNIPGAVLQMVAGKMPMVVASVRNYLGKHGPPPSLRVVAGSFYDIQFDHAVSEFTATLAVDTAHQQTTELLLSPQRYPKGATVDLSTGAEIEVSVIEDKVVAIKHLSGSTLKVNVKITSGAGAGGKIKVVSQGKDLYSPAPAAALKATTTTTATTGKTSSLVWPPTHRFAKTAEEAITRFKELAHKEASSANGWTEINRAKDVIVTKQASDVPLGVLRGDGVIKGYNTFECYAVSAFPSCRKVWDELFEDGKPVENLDDSTILSYASTKGQFPVSGRDMAVLLISDFNLDGRIYCVSVSVVDPQIPAAKGKVRANLKLNGWYLEPLVGEKGTRVVYISEIDLNGSIPGAILNLVAQKMPLVVADVRKYLTRSGPPPFFDRIGATVVTTPDFDHGTSVFDTKIKIDNTISPFTSILLSKQRYPNGCEVTLNPGDAVRTELAADGASLILHHDDASKNGVILSIKAKPLAGGALGQIKVIAAGVPTAATSTSSAASAASAGPSIAEWVNVLPDQISRLEDALNGLQQKQETPVAQQALGLAFLASIPVVAAVLARVWG